MPHAGNKRLEHDFLNLHPNPFPLNVISLQFIFELSEGQLTPTKLFLSLGKHPRRLVAVLLYTVISQVHKLIPNLLQIITVGFSADPRKPLSVNKALERVDGGDQDVNAQVELVTVEEERVVDVLLHHDRLAEDHFLQLADEGNATPAGHAHRFENP